MTDNIADSMPFSKLMGVRVTSADKDLIAGELVVRPDLCTAWGTLHGGAIMAFADALGAIGSFMNLPDGATGTTTIESKTNFIRAAKEGTTITAEATPLSRGRRVSVWQTSMKRSDGKLIAQVTQTQMVL